MSTLNDEAAGQGHDRRLQDSAHLHGEQQTSSTETGEDQSEKKFFTLFSMLIYSRDVNLAKVVAASRDCTGTGNCQKEATLRHIFWALLTHMSPAGYCQVGQARLQQITGFGETTVSNGLAAFEMAGFFRREGDWRAQGSRRTDKFWLSPETLADMREARMLLTQSSRRAGRQRRRCS